MVNFNPHQRRPCELTLRQHSSLACIEVAYTFTHRGSVCPPRTRIRRDACYNAGGG